jgi:hypothetical protein
MLQRIQSIYLFLAGLVIFALFLFPLVHNVSFAAMPSTITVTGVYVQGSVQQMHVKSFTGLETATVIAGLLPIALIFLYGNRKRQIALCYFYIFLLFGYAYWQMASVKELLDISTFKIGNFGIGVLLCPISIVLVLAAIKAIQRDEKLVRSADRLR